MASIKLGTLVTDIRGAVGGTIFSRNRGGAYARKNTSPTNPMTSDQTTVRATMANVSAEWRNLTSAQKNAWNAAAPNFPYLDKFGDSREYSGQQLFLKMNLMIFALDPAATLTTSPPAPQSLTAISQATITLTNVAGVLTFTGTINSATVLPAGQELVAYASAGKSAGVTAPSSAGQYKLLGSQVPGAGGTITFTTPYGTAWGVPPVGAVVFVEYWTVDPLTGQSIPGITRRYVVA